MNSKLNRGGYSNRTLSVFEIIGAYFVDVFYNHIYLTAEKNHKLYGGSSTKSLTDEYKSALVAYNEGITKSKKHYEQTIKGILEFYRTYTKFTTISMNDFINELLQQFIPEEHFTIFTDQEKHFFLNKIITAIIYKFIGRITQIDLMKMVIDDHDNTDNTRRYIDVIVDLMIIEREELFNQFVKQTRGHNVDDEQVSVEVVRKITQDRDALWNQLQELLKQKCELEAKLIRARAVAEVLHEKVTMYEKLVGAPDQQPPTARSMKRGSNTPEPMYQRAAAALGIDDSSDEPVDMLSARSATPQRNSGDVRNANRGSRASNNRTTTNVHNISSNISTNTPTGSSGATPNNISSDIIDDVTTDRDNHTDTDDTNDHDDANDDQPDPLAEAMKKIQASSAGSGSIKRGVRKLNNNVSALDL